MKDITKFFFEFLKKAAKKTTNPYDDIAVELIEKLVSNLSFMKEEEK